MRFARSASKQTIPLLAGFSFFVLALSNIGLLRKLLTLDGVTNAAIIGEPYHSDISRLTRHNSELQRENNKLKKRLHKYDGGIEQVYIDFLKEAERRSELDYNSSHERGKKGIVVGPIDGKFKYMISAMENARRIRTVLASDSGVKLAIITSKEYVDILSGCRRDKSAWQELLTAEACRLWANGTLFDDIVFNKEQQVWVNDSHVVDRLGSRYILTSLGGSLLAPYQQSLLLDSDSYPCPGVEKLFGMLVPYSNKLWPLPSTAKVDLVTSLEQYPWQAPRWKWVFGNDTSLHSDFQYFADRNTGALLYNYENQLTHTFAHFVQLVAPHVINHIASLNMLVMGDQTPYKIALYLFQKLRPEFNEVQFPSHVSCRTYLNRSHAGIDGAINGMYPKQKDGKICTDCHCTPCLINHNANTMFVTINGKRGW